MVSRIAPLRPIGMIVCTEPLPNERVPSTRRAAMVLQRAGDDLRRRGRAAVQEHDDRLAVDQIAGAGAEALHLVGMAAAGGDDLAPVEEGVGDEHRLVEQPARIAAQVEHEALQLVRRDRPLRSCRSPSPGPPSSAR